MKLSINRTSLTTSFAELKLEHDTIALLWDYTIFRKSDQVIRSGQISEGSGRDLFFEINAYWASLPKSRQDELFSIYKRIKEAFDQIWVTQELTTALYPLVAELCDAHELTSIEQWVRQYSGIQIPSELKETFEITPTMSGTREKTYLKSDYQDLVVLSIFLRIMIPVWGEFISKTKEEIGPLWMDFNAYALMSRAKVVQSRAVLRLRTYLESTVRPDPDKVDRKIWSAILMGVGSQKLVDWHMASVLVRKITIGDVRAEDGTPVLASSIFNFIRSRLSRDDGGALGQVKDKAGDKATGIDDDTKASKLEGYKITQSISEGDIGTLSYYASNPYVVATCISPTLPLDLLDQSIRSVQTLQGERYPTIAQVRLLEWIVDDAFSAKAIAHFDKPIVLNLMACAQAILWYREHFDLAAILTAKMEGNEEEMLHIGTESRSKISKELLDELNNYWPYQKRPNTKNRAIKQSNVAVGAIDAISERMRENDWRLTLPTDWLSKINTTHQSRRFAAPQDIQIKLAKLAIQIAQKAL